MKKTDQAELTTTQAAEIASVTNRTIRNWIESGELPARTQPLGGTYLYFIKPEDLQAFLKTHGQPRKD